MAGIVAMAEDILKEVGDELRLDEVSSTPSVWEVSYNGDLIGRIRERFNDVPLYRIEPIGGSPKLCDSLPQARRMYARLLLNRLKA